MPYQVQDANLIKTAALPNGAAATQTTGIDLELTVRSDLVAACELVISAPALTTGELPDGQTITYSVETDDNSGFSSAKVINGNAGVQTGAGGVGAAAQELRVRLPSNCERHVRVKATKTGAANASAKSMTVALAT